jgi:hypothetical protein
MALDIKGSYLFSVLTNDRPSQKSHNAFTNKAQLSPTASMHTLDG